MGNVTGWNLGLVWHLIHTFISESVSIKKRELFLGGHFCIMEHKNYLSIFFNEDSVHIFVILITSLSLKQNGTEC